MFQTLKKKINIENIHKLHKEAVYA